MDNYSNKRTTSDNLQKTKEQWLQEGIEFYNSKRYREAITACEQAIRIDTKYARAYHGKGLALEALNQYKEAVVAYKRAVDLQPLNIEIYHDLGMLLYEMKYYRASGVIYRRAIRINPEIFKQYSSLTIKIVDEGKAFRALDYPFDFDVESTLHACEDAILFNPLCAYAYAEKGRVLFVNQSYRDAGNAFKNAIQLDSGQYVKGCVKYQRLVAPLMGLAS